MKFGDRIQMLRDYDDGRYRAGETYRVDVPGEPEGGTIRPNVAKTLCGPAADDEGPYAERVEDESTATSEEE